MESNTEVLIKRTITDSTKLSKLFNDDDTRTLYFGDVEITMSREILSILVAICIEDDMLKWLWEHKDEGKA